MRIPACPGLALVLLLSASPLFAQETADASAAKAKPPEGERIVNLPSADVPRAGTLTILFTHRFTQPVEDSNIHSLFSFDSGADIGIGLTYTPVENLDVSLYRSSNLDVYELDAKYHVLARGPVSLSVRAGGDRRTEVRLENRSGFFAQAIVAFSVGSRVRLTAVPTYVSKTSGQRFVAPKPFYENLFSVPGAIAIAVTRSVNVQAEVYPRLSRADSPGVGWIAAIEKTVLRHRFAFTVGNMRGTTVDQYVGSDFGGQSPRNYFLGFNLVRQWKL